MHIFTLSEPGAKELGLENEIGEEKGKAEPVQTEKQAKAWLKKNWKAWMEGMNAYIFPVSDKEENLLGFGACIK